MDFNWTFVKGEYYQFEVVGISWTGNRTMILYSDTGMIGTPVNGPPWVWYVPQEGRWEEDNSTFDPHDPWDMTRMKEVVFESPETIGGVASEAEQGTHVNVYKAVETSVKLYDYLLYVGASVAIIGAAIAAIGVMRERRL